MASFYDYWARVRAKNPHMPSSNTDLRMTLTVDEFERHLRRAYDQGRTDERENVESQSVFARVFGSR